MLVDSGILRDPATPDYLATYVKELGVDMVSTVDPEFSTAQYFPNGGLPMQLLVSLPDMKIVLAEAGPANIVDAALAEHLE